MPIRRETLAPAIKRKELEQPKKRDWPKTVKLKKALFSPDEHVFYIALDGTKSIYCVKSYISSTKVVSLNQYITKDMLAKGTKPKKFDTQIMNGNTLRVQKLWLSLYEKYWMDNPLSKSEPKRVTAVEYDWAADNTWYVGLEEDGTGKRFQLTFSAAARLLIPIPS